MLYVEIHSNVRSLSMFKKTFGFKFNKRPSKSGEQYAGTSEHGIVLENIMLFFNKWR